MNDILIFAAGCFVSLIVAAAVGLLMWGAAQEPEEVLPDTQGKGRTATPPPSVSSARV